MINIAFYFDIPGKGLLSGKQMWLAGKSTKNNGFWLGKSSMNGVLSIATFVLRRVLSLMLLGAVKGFIFISWEISYNTSNI
jgi:hypothetical protein